MKATVGKLALAAVIVAGLLAVGVMAGDAKWCDPQNCAACKAMAGKPGLMEAMKTEAVKLSNGMVTVYTVAPEKLEDYRAAHAEMRATMQKIMGGEKLPLCGHCQAMVDVVQQGAQREFAPTSTGGMCLITSSDPKVQEKIWAFMDKDAQMKKEMKAQEEAGKKTTQ